MENYYAAKRLALILAVQAEIEGMKAENMQRQILGHSMAYSENDFADKAMDLRNIAYALDEQL